MSDVVFRRIHGRIVPIKRKNPMQSGDVLTGVKLGVSGALATVAGAEAAGRLGMFGKRQAHASRLFTAKATNLIAKGNQESAMQALSKSVKHFKKAKATIGASKIIAGATALVGGGLLAAGAINMIPKEKRDTATKFGALGAIGIASGAGSLAVVNHIVKKRAFPFLK